MKSSISEHLPNKHLLQTFHLPWIPKHPVLFWNIVNQSLEDWKCIGLLLLGSIHSPPLYTLVRSNIELLKTRGDIHTITHIHILTYSHINIFTQQKGKNHIQRFHLTGKQHCFPAFSWKPFNPPEKNVYKIGLSK